MARQKQERAVSDELIDQLLKQGRKPEDVHGLLKQLTKAVVERGMQAEMNEHLGYERRCPRFCVNVLAVDSQPGFLSKRIAS